jgi:hypothetical protein
MPRDDPSLPRGFGVAQPFVSTGPDAGASPFCLFYGRPSSCDTQDESSKALSLEPRKASPMLMTILLVLLVLSLVGGGFGHSRFGYAGWSPAGILIAIFVVMLLTGHLHA